MLKAFRCSRSIIGITPSNHAIAIPAICNFDTACCPYLHVHVNLFRFFSRSPFRGDPVGCHPGSDPVGCHPGSHLGSHPTGCHSASLTSARHCSSLKIVDFSSEQFLFGCFNLKLNSPSRRRSCFYETLPGVPVMSQCDFCQSEPVFLKDVVGSWCKNCHDVDNHIAQACLAEDFKSPKDRQADVYAGYFKGTK